VRETIPAVLAGERLDRVVAMLTGLARAAVADLVASGAVTVGGVTVTTRSRKLAEGDVVEVAVPPPTEQGLVPDPDVEVPVAWEDEHLVVVDKPAGLVVHPGAGHAGGTLVHGLVARYPQLRSGPGDPERPGIVHRLDKGTSGLLAVALTPAAFAGLTAQLQARAVDRRYTALVWGTVEGAEGVVDAPIGRAGADPTRMAVSRRGREARTHYRVQERFTEPVPLTLLECRLETGRTHQIRVHLAAIGHPVVGDARYGGGRAELRAPRPFLHAGRLAFDHPVTGARVDLRSPLPDDLKELHGRVH
jgi:23S rRNA pseudouridine1911/1915/1917 synthase